MSSLASSAGGFSGIGPGGPKMGVQGGNAALSNLQDQGNLFGNTSAIEHMNNYGLGSESSQDVLKGFGDNLSGAQLQGLENQLATGATTGSKFATEQVQNNPILASLFGEKGLMQNEADQLNKQVNQGWSLQPEDQTMYGQAAGNIARQFGQQGNQAANDLASRGLSSSGAAGAAFSGLAGNQNEMLAKAQQNIMQQRFQNTMAQMGQMNQLAQTAGGAIQQQYGRQLQGAEAQQSGLAQTAGLQNQANAGANQANLQAGMFDQANKPQNVFDDFIGASFLGAGAAAKQKGQMVGSSPSSSSSSVATDVEA